MTTPIKIISKQEFLKKNKNEKPNQEDVWDSISDLWNEYRKEPYEIIKDFLEDKKGKIIDLGCGSGRNMIPSPDIEYYGVDISSCQLGCAMVHAEEKGINAKFFKNKADKLSKKDFKKEMFDFGLFIATLHCLENKNARENALKELYRVLKKGAEALITVWNSEDERFKNVNYHGDIYMSWKKDGEEYFRYYYLYDKDEFLDLLKSVGFEILEVKTNLDIKDSTRITDSIKDRFSKKNWIVKVKK